MLPKLGDKINYEGEIAEASISPYCILKIESTRCEGCIFKSNTKQVCMRLTCITKEKIRIIWRKVDDNNTEEGN